MPAAHPETSAHARRVAGYYDGNTESFYQRYWNAEHLHFGLFDDPAAAGLGDALARMVDRVVAPAALTAGDRVLDAGCGVGGAALQLSASAGCAVLGLTVSARQVALAQQRAAALGRDHLVTFAEADCSTMLPCADGSIDAIVSFEAACHFADRPQFVRECVRVLAPGGRLALTDWVAADGLAAGEARARLDPVCDAWFLPGLETPASWCRLLHDGGLLVVEREDLDAAVRPNLPILSRAILDLRLEAAAGGHDENRLLLWLRQLETLTAAWRAGAFTIVRAFATRPLP